MLKRSKENDNKLIDSFGRIINYLRISVTDRCNQRCLYCCPKGEFTKFPREEILSFENIYDFAKIAVSYGVSKIKLTGGEPLVRKNVPYLVELLASIPGIKDLGMTTNGVLLKNFSNQLKHAGLHRINISLDTLVPKKYEMITNGGSIHDVFEGIEAAKKGGLEPVKINCVVMPEINENEIEDMQKFCESSSLDLQFIQLMDLHKKNIQGINQSIFSRPPLCELCNKLRLSSNGFIFPCLYSNRSTSIRSAPSFSDALMKAVQIKPATSDESAFEAMAEIGG